MDSWMINLLLFSDKRRDFLLLLKDGPKNIDVIGDELKVPRNSLLPQIKKLKEKGLIVRDGDDCRLTILGNIIVRKLQPLVDAALVLDIDDYFWVSRKLDTLPSCFLGRVGELKGCCLVEPEPEHVFDLIPEIVSAFREPSRAMMLFSYFHPLLPSFFLNVAKNGIKFPLILNRGVFERFLTDFRDEGEEILKHENVNVFVLEDNALEVPSVVAISESTLILGLLNKWERADRQYVVSCKPCAVKWGKELFSFYKERARKVTSLEEPGLCDPIPPESAQK
ncbi:helix-turn-helix transcriptional regulator [Methanosarcina sp. Mfa9]|uniref:helix-turn-helix transcriptional regulator n=1 Tax=Methanosarcina sp. Mfa9 TaxID=3439063 RepID=UPI003F84332C